MLEKAGKRAEAVRILERLVAEKDIEGSAASNLIDMYKRDGRVQEAITLCRQQICLLTEAAENEWCVPCQLGEPYYRRNLETLQRQLSADPQLSNLPSVFPTCNGAWIFLGCRNASVAALCSSRGGIRVAWPELGDLSSLTVDSLGTTVAAVFRSRGISFLRRTVLDVGAFRFGMRVNDPVLSYVRKDDWWLLGRVIGDYEYDPAGDPAKPHFRAVDWGKPIFDRSIPGEIRKRLRRFQSIRDIGTSLWNGLSATAGEHATAQTGTTVPPWEGGRRTGNAPEADRERFLKSFIAAAEQGEYLDVQGNGSYVGAYESHVIQACRKANDPETLVTKLEQLRRAYPQFESVQVGINCYLGEFLWWRGDFERAWQYKRRYAVWVSTVLDIRNKCQDTRLDGSDILAISGKGYLQSIGLNQIDEVRQQLTVMSDELYNKCQRNCITDFCSKFDMFSLRTADFEMLQEMCGDRSDFERLRKLYGTGPDDPENYSDCYKGGIRYREPIYFFGRRGKHMKLIRETMVPPVVRLAAGCITGKMVQEAEAQVRQRMGVPPVGEGWVSETVLFRAIQRAFPDTKVVQHWRADWLGQQHLDIFIPALRVAVEYQGAQHFAPVDRFGGQAGFVATQERDRQKAKCCRNQGVKLIYAMPDAPVANVVADIRIAAGFGLSAENASLQHKEAGYERRT
jgi:hypothetical protein